MADTLNFIAIKVSFPYKDCDVNNRLDVLLLHELKETFCHLSQVKNILSAMSECFDLIKEATVQGSKLFSDSCWSC